MHVPQSLSFRSVIGEGPGDRFTDWVSRLASDDVIALRTRNLYSGDHWQVSLSLPHVAYAAGFEPHLYVASAGWGLISADDLIKPYNATFSTSSEDAVSKTNQESREWWKLLSSWEVSSFSHSRSVRELVANDPLAACLVVCSPPYLAAMQDDLETVATSIQERDRFIILSTGIKNGSSIQAELTRNIVSTGATLQSLVGGALHSLNPRLARWALEKMRENEFRVDEWSKTFQEAAKGAKPRRRYNRIAQSDDEVRAFIEDQIRASGTLSKTRLLRIFRDSGKQCEQSRFGILFDDVKENSNA